MSKDGSGKVTGDAKRRHLNEVSMGWADRQRQPWSDEDDLYLLNEWVLKSGSRNETEISQHLRRSIYACQGRAESLREMLGVQSTVSTRATPAPRPVCGTCFTELPISGQCDNCD